MSEIDISQILANELRQISDAEAQLHQRGSVDVIALTDLQDERPDTVETSIVINDRNVILRGFLLWSIPSRIDPDHVQVVCYRCEVMS